MRIALAILMMLACLTGCRKQSIFSSRAGNENKMIALQPLGQHQFDEQQLEYVRDQLSEFYNIRVIIMKPAEIPASFRKVSSTGEICSADSLIKFLSKFCNDTIVDVVGLTHNDIFTITEHKMQVHNRDTIALESKGIFGLGYIYGSSCIISDYRLMTTDTELLNHRLRNVILHEIGHNLGLPHCSNDTCLMSEQNGNIRTLDKNSGNYCNICKRKLN